MSFKKFTLTLFAVAASTVAFGQQANVIKSQQLEASKVTFDKAEALGLNNAAELTPTAKQIPQDYQKPVVNPNGVNAVTPVELGRASNAFTILRESQNQVFADEGTGLVGFIHRHDVTIWGGGGGESGKYRLDLSIDGGQSFSNDIDVLNNTYQRPARYPNAFAFDPGNATGPLDMKVGYMGATLNPAPDWDGVVTGVSNVATAAPLGATENYLLQNAGTLIPGGSTEGKPGEFWAIDNQYISAAVTDSIVTFKGTWNATTQDIDWNVFDANMPNFNTSYDGSTYFTTPDLAVSPDGNTIWQAMLGDLVGGHDSVFSPVLRSSTDGGATWGSWIEVDLRTVPWIADSLQILWVDSLGDPASTGRPTTAFDFDVTVDADGNPHVLAVIGSASSSTNPVPGYSIFSGLAMFTADIYSTDGGTTWTADYIAPCLALRGEFGTGQDLLTMDNYPQIARSDDGNYIYYSWVDSDTSVTGFGNNTNSAPNLRIAGKRITDGYRTCYKLVTDGDILWDGAILFPTMAPTGIRKAGGANHHLPIVFLNMITNDQLQPCNFWYLGGDAVLYESDFVDPATLSLSWDANCAVVSNEAAAPTSDITLFQSFPNPNNGLATIRFELPTAQDVVLDLVNMYGQQVGVLSSGNFAAGQHDVEVNTSELAAGVYFYNLKAGEKVFTKKMIVTK